MEEIPAGVYVTEVSHRWNGSPYAFSTGLVANSTIGIWNSPIYDSLYAGVGRSGEAVPACGPRSRIAP